MIEVKDQPKPRLETETGDLSRWTRKKMKTWDCDRRSREETKTGEPLTIWCLYESISITDLPVGICRNSNNLAERLVVNKFKETVRLKNTLNNIAYVECYTKHIQLFVACMKSAVPPEQTSFICSGIANTVSCYNIVRHSAGPFGVERKLVVCSGLGYFYLCALFLMLLA